MRACIGRPRAPCAPCPTSHVLGRSRAQMDKSDFHPREDYLDMLMQFGYVCMFTTCWALAPVPAFLNNILELRGDVFKLIYNSRRPVPAWDRYDAAV